MNLTYLWLALGAQRVPETPVDPKVGMTWDVVHHRKRPHSYRGYTEQHGPVQIVSVDGDDVELLENNIWLGKVNWCDYYRANLIQPVKPVKNDPSGGYIVHYYRGIKLVDEARVEQRRHPFVLRPGY